MKPTGAVLWPRARCSCADAAGTGDYSRMRRRQPLQPAVQPRRVAATRSTSAASPRLRRRRRRRAPGPGRLGHQPLGQRQRIVLRLRRGRTRTCRPAGWRRSTPRQRLQPAPGGRGRPAGAPPAPARLVGASASAASAAALDEHRRARAVELDQLADGVAADRRQHQPAQAPAGHQEALGEAVRRRQPVVGARRCPGSSARGRRVAEPDALVDLVGHDPGAGAAAVRRGSPAARRASASSRSGCWAR